MPQVNNNSLVSTIADCNWFEINNTKRMFFVSDVLRRVLHQSQMSPPVNTLYGEIFFVLPDVFFSHVDKCSKHCHARTVGIYNPEIKDLLQKTLDFYIKLGRPTLLEQCD